MTVGKPAVTSFDFSKVKLFIAIPTRGTSSISFSESLAVTCCALTMAKVEVSIFYHQSNNFVDMSRNKLVAEFLKSDCTHIFFVDDDMGWNADAVLKMLSCDKDFIAGIGNLKTDSGEDFAANLYSNSDGTTIIEGPHYLMSAQFVGGAFLILKRTMIEKMIESYQDLVSVAVDPVHGYSLFEPKYRPLWMTEDYNFCERWRLIGGKIWAYPNISFTHQGTKDWKGNYFEFRKERAKKEQPQAVLDEQRGDVPESVKVLLCQSYVDRVARAVIRISHES